MEAERREETGSQGAYLRLIWQGEKPDARGSSWTCAYVPGSV